MLTRWVEARGLETGGALPVPEGQRRMRASGLFTVWLMTPAGVTGPLVGYLFFKYGTWNFLATVAIAFMIGFVPAGVLSEMGRDVPITSVVYARRCFGMLGTLPVAILLALVSLGFFGLTSAVIATILAAATNTSSRLWDGVVGIVAVVLVVVGIRLVERCYRYTRIVVPICYAGLVLYLSETFGLRFPSQTTPMKWGPALTLVLTLSLLSWGYVLPTVSRFCTPRSNDDRRANVLFFVAPSLALMMTLTCLGIIGMLAEGSAGTWNLAMRAAESRGWSLALAVILAVAAIPGTAMNIYSGSMNLLSAQNTVWSPRQWQQPVTTIALGFIGTSLAVLGILTHVAVFLDQSAVVLVPFTFVVAADWLWVKGRRADVANFFESSRGVRTSIGWPAWGSFLFGIGLSVAGLLLLPQGVQDYIPMPVAGGVMAAGLYVTIARRVARVALVRRVEQ